MLVRTPSPNSLSLFFNVVLCLMLLIFGVVIFQQTGNTEHFQAATIIMGTVSIIGLILAKVLILYLSSGNKNIAIPPQKKQEDALRELNKELESFTHIASHDLRSPLVNMKGFTKEIETSLSEAYHQVQNAAGRLTAEETASLKKIFEEDIPESLGFIHSAMGRMDMLTAAILNLSRIGKRAYKPTLVDVEAIVKRCLQNLNHELEEQGAKTIIGTLPAVLADELAIEYVFSNVIENALKYLDPKRPGALEISGSAYHDEIVYAIRDNGRGIEDQDADKVFDIFRRARNTGPVSGAGMGLAFVKATLRKMGGRIWYESKIDHGTTFYLALPKTHGE